MTDESKIGFIGAGKMAGALAGGLLKKGLVTQDQLMASDIFENALKAFVSDTGAATAKTNSDLAKHCRVLFLCVKPDQVNQALEPIGCDWNPQNLLISIVAGKKIESLESCLPQGARVIRVMPNTPALVGESASAFAAGKAVTADDRSMAETLLGAVGLAVEVKEEQLDGVTGLSGSGPAYVFQFIEALSDGGVASGLPRHLALQLAVQTVLGAAKMVLETGRHPAELKDMVASPAGTTIEGIHQLEKGGMRGVVMNAVCAATEKSRNLG